MGMYDVIVQKAKIMRQKHKNMFESAVLIVKRAKTRANARGALCTRRTRRTRLAESSGAWCMNGEYSEYKSWKLRAQKLEFEK